MIAPGATIGILGGGQLGRMLAISAAELGYRVHIYCPEADCPASEVAKTTTIAAFEDTEALKRFAETVNVVTYEFENIPAAPVAALAKHVQVFPSPDILSLTQHRVLEKQAINAMGIATAPFMPVHSLTEFQTAVTQIGLPVVLKTTSMGYDGKGQWIIRSEKIAPTITLPFEKENAGTDGKSAPYILESFIPFRMEISVIVARDAQGNIACYPPVQNIHKNHILAETIVPAAISPQLAHNAESIARRIAEGLKLVGLMAVEMFVTDHDEVLVNELAPRPHNSGHWTLDACITSQFEQTIRAICGLPLGSVERLCDATMINLIGDDIQGWAAYAANPNAKLHLYGKKEARAGRKMGHVTFLSGGKNTTVM